MEGRRGTRSATPQGNNKADMLDESSQHSQTYLLDRMGGEAALEAVVEEFYVRLIGDPKLKHFFEGVNMRKLKRHQRGFLKVAFTKIPDSIDVPMLLLKKHERLFSEMSLDETHFDLVAAHLIETMQSLGLKQTLIDEAVAIVAPLRSVFEAGATSGKKNGVHVKILNSGSYMSSESDDGAVRALLRSLKFSGVKFLRFMVVDACNNIRSKAVPLEQCRVDTVVTFAKVCFAGLPFFADIVLPQTGFDARDLLVVRPDFGTLRILPYNTSSAAVLCTAHDGDTLSPLCTRGLLARVVETAQSEHNLVFNVGFELEFTLHDAKTGDFVDDSVFANSTTLNQQETFITDLYDQLKMQEIEIEMIHAESGPGQLEVVLKYLPNPVRMVDNVVLCRETIHNVARINGMKALFLPKSDMAKAGNGLHMHLSFSAATARSRSDVFSADGSTGDAASTATAEENYFAREGQSFVEGILQHLPGLLAVTIPSVNSFRRVGKGCWTGYELGWAVEDKEAPLRLCRDVHTGFLSNVELKLSDSTANLYLSLACVLACGLNGIVNKLKLRPALNLQPGAPLPTTFGEALTALVKDKYLVEEVLGLELGRGYLALRKAEAERSCKMKLEEELAEALRKA